MSLQGLVTDGGRYRLVRELGRGAMGAVHEALELSSGRRVAIKQVLGEAGSQAQERLAREAELLARLNHPGILKVHALGTLRGRPFMACELVSGARTLAEALPAAPRETRVEWIRQAAEALGSAHAAGCVHRDVKPENLLLDAAGRLRVADFGIASAEGLERMTQSNAFLGTPHYMAPEMVAAERAQWGPTLDVWSVGVVLYEALTDELPFQSGSLLGLLAAISSAAPTPPRALVPDLDPRLEAICLHALAAEPARRYPQGQALAEDLAAFQAGRPLSLRPPRRRRGPALAAAGLVLVGGLLVVRGSPQEPRDAEPAAPAQPASAPQSIAPVPSTSNEEERWARAMRKALPFLQAGDAAAGLRLGLEAGDPALARSAQALETLSHQEFFAFCTRLGEKPPCPPPLVAKVEAAASPYLLQWNLVRRQDEAAADRARQTLACLLIVRGAGAHLPGESAQAAIRVGLSLGRGSKQQVAHRIYSLASTTLRGEETFLAALLKLSPHPAHLLALRDAEARAGSERARIVAWVGLARLYAQSSGAFLSAQRTPAERLHEALGRRLREASPAELAGYRQALATGPPGQLEAALGLLANTLGHPDSAERALDAALARGHRAEYTLRKFLTLFAPQAEAAPAKRAKTLGLAGLLCEYTRYAPDLRVALRVVWKHGYAQHLQRKPAAIRALERVLKRLPGTEFVLYWASLQAARGRASEALNLLRTRFRRPPEPTGNPIRRLERLLDQARERLASGEPPQVLAPALRELALQAERLTSGRQP